MEAILNPIEKSFKELTVKVNSFFRKGEKASRKTIGYAKAEKVAVLALYESDDSIESLAPLIKQLKADGKTVSIFCWKDFIPKEEAPKTGILNIAVNYITYKDITLSGDFTDESKALFFEESFDFLYCCVSEYHLIIEKILHTSHAKCRVGVHSEKYHHCFELQVKHDKKENNAIALFLHYTKLLTNQKATV